LNNQTGDYDIAKVFSWVRSGNNPRTVASRVIGVGNSQEVYAVIIGSYQLKQVMC
jgi:hypothetical protein